MIHVVAAVIRGGNRILVARRPDHVHQGGLWEFPGGKKHTGESRKSALRRELAEELGIEAVDFRPLIQIPHQYPDKQVFLDVWEVTRWTGDPHGKEGQPVQWVRTDELGQLAFPEANFSIIKAAQLPAHYLITPSLEGSQGDFLAQLQAALDTGISLVQYRQKQLTGSRFEQLAGDVIRCCHDAGARVLLNAPLELVTRLGADGVQLNANDLMLMKRRPLPESSLVAASCHNEAELQKASKLSLDFALLSPVQRTATHPDARPVGWDKFSDMVGNATIPVYALGGVSRSDTGIAWNHGGQGVAAIRALWSESLS